MSTSAPAASSVSRPHMIGDSLTMLGRQLRHAKRYPEMTVILLALPVIFLLLFAYVFGGTLGAGLAPGVGPQGGSRADYVNYVVPGILLLTIGSIAAGTSTSVAMDMTQGIIARFRTMSIAPTAVLSGHALGSVLQSMGTFVVRRSASSLAGKAVCPDWPTW